MKRVTVLIVASLLLAPLNHMVLVPVSAVSVINVPGDYSTIQEALNIAGPGDMIRVEPGTYPETLSITRSVLIEGKNRQTTVLDAIGGGPAISVRASGARISNLTITNVGAGKDGVLIENSANVTVSKIDILLSHRSENGTQILNSQQVRVEGNRITGANLYGIVVDQGRENVVARNELTDNLVGVGVFRGSRTIVVDNNFAGPGESGVDLWTNARDIVIAHNRISGFNSTGIHLIDAPGNVIQENTIAGIEDPKLEAYAAAIRLQNSTGNAFFLNDLIDNPDLYAQGVFEQDRTGNVWNAYGGLGNYWGNYTGQDDGSVDSRTGAPRVAGDGVGDSRLPHVFDWYPLMQPWNSTPRSPVATLRVLVLDQDGKSIGSSQVVSTSQPTGQTSLRASSDGGRLNFYGILGGNYALTVSAVGYESASKMVLLAERTLRVENFTLVVAPFSPISIIPYVAAASAVVAGIVGIYVFRRRSRPSRVGSNSVPVFSPDIAVSDTVEILPLGVFSEILFS